MAPVCVVACWLGGCTRVVLNYFKFVERRLRLVGRLFLGAMGAKGREKRGGEWRPPAGPKNWETSKREEVTGVISRVERSSNSY